jgi:integrase
MFRWAISEELLPAEISRALDTVFGLSAGRTEAIERPPVKPVSDVDFDATLLYLPPVVRDLAKFHRLAGCRTTEACRIRPADVEQTGEIWLYRPRSHKTEHYGYERLIYLGKQAQALLAPYLERDPDAFCFSPSESESQRKSAARLARKTKVQPSQQNRKSPAPKNQPGVVYDKTSYPRAVRRACDKAKISRWHPGQLRHAAATEIRAAFGLEAAQVILGHQKADVTQIYAEKNQELAKKVRGLIG